MNDNFDIFNDIKIHFDEYEQVNLTDLEKTNMKNRVENRIKGNKDRLVRKNIIAAALTIAVIGSVILSNESVRAQINSIGVNIGSFFNREDNHLEKYTTKVLKSTMDKGITFSLNEVMIDDGQLVASIRVDSSGIDRRKLGIEQKGDLKIIPAGFVSAFVDGKELVGRGGGVKMQYNSDGTVDILMNQDFPEADLNKNYNIKFVCNQLQTQVSGRSSNIINGNWTLDFLASGKSMADLVKVIPINKEITIKNAGDNVNILLKELRCSPYSAKLIYDEKGPKEKMYMYGLTLFDEKGNEFDVNSGRSIDTGDFMGEYIINNTSKKIKIVPHIYDNNRMTFLKDKGVEVDISIK